jgi:hypothetical protein
VVVQRGGIDLDLSAGRTGYEDGDLAIQFNGLLDDSGAFAESLPCAANLFFGDGGTSFRCG